jgi:hypothetical protein
MDETVVWVVWVDPEFVRACSKVAFLAKVNVAVWENGYPNSNVKFSLFYEEGSFYILLYDKAIMFVFRFTLLRWLNFWRDLTLSFFWRLVVLIAVLFDSLNSHLFHRLCLFLPLI